MSFTAWDAKDRSGHAAKEFRIERDGFRDITGAVWLPEEAMTDKLICFGHGASGDRFQPPVSELAQKFAAEGHPVLALDGPDHGLRQTGEGGRAGMFADIMREECLDEMTRDWTSAIDALKSEFDIAASTLAYFGLSMGTTYGLPFLAGRSDVAVAVLGLWALRNGVPHNDDFRACAEKLDLPVLFIMQADDEFWPQETYIELFNAIGSKNKRLHANPGVHAEIPLDEVDYAADFILARLAGAPQKAVRPMLQIVDA